jgi:hypothetical protein
MRRDQLGLVEFVVNQLGRLRRRTSKEKAASNVIALISPRGSLEDVMRHLLRWLVKTGRSHELGQIQNGTACPAAPRTEFICDQPRATQRMLLA